MGSCPWPEQGCYPFRNTRANTSFQHPFTRIILTSAPQDEFGGTIAYGMFDEFGYKEVQIHSHGV